MIHYFTDPHLGRSAKAHTTPHSRVSLDLSLKINAQFCCRENTVCLGDLFHKSHNPETVILQGAEIASQCEVVLAGNHDLTNRIGGNSSLALLASLPIFSEKICIASAGEKYHHNKTIEGVKHTFVPHHSSQELFEDTLSQLIGGDILCLHCNVNCTFAEGDDAALNITTPQLKQLLGKYKYILIGHEHNGRELFDGRVKILGNTHPTSFSDISDKYLYKYDPKGDVWDKEIVWSKADNHTVVEFKDLYNTDLSDYQFIEITGNLDSVEDVKHLSECMARLWANSPDLLMLRNKTTFNRQEIDNDLLIDESDLENLITVVDRMVKGTGLEKAWIKYKGLADA